MIVGVVSQNNETRWHSKNAAAKCNHNNGFLEREISYQDKKGSSSTNLGQSRTLGRNPGHATLCPRARGIYVLDSVLAS